jgi:hypothetical protein
MRNNGLICRTDNSSGFGGVEQVGLPENIFLPRVALFSLSLPKRRYVVEVTWQELFMR